MARRRTDSNGSYVKDERDEVILVLSIEITALELKHNTFIRKIESSRFTKQWVETEVEDIRH